MYYFDCKMFDRFILMAKHVRYINVVLFVFIISSGISNAQRSILRTPKTDQDTLMVRVESGGSVDFRVNSIRKYNEGLEYNNWSRLAVLVILSSTSNSWDLEFKAFTEHIIGDGGNEIDLSYISIVAEDGGGNKDLSSFIQGEKSLESDYQTLIAGVDTEGDFHDFKIYITYRLGKGAEKLLGESPGYYVVDLEFRVTAQ